MKKRKRFIVKDTLKFDGKIVPVKIYIEHRTSVRATIRPTGVHIRIPATFDIDKRIEQVNKYKKWAVEKLRENPNAPVIKPAREYKNEDILLVGSDKYKLRITYSGNRSSTVLLKGNIIYLEIAANLPTEYQYKHISTLLSRCIAHRRLPALRKIINELNENYFNVKINRISFRHSNTRWGSCSTKGNITISTRLIFAPDDVIEYVCVHEIAHIIQPNHSPEFWALVAKAVPDFKQKLKWLKENREKCRY